MLSSKNYMASARTERLLPLRATVRTPMRRKSNQRREQRSSHLPRRPQLSPLRRLSSLLAAVMKRKSPSPKLLSPPHPKKPLRRRKAVQMVTRRTSNKLLRKSLDIIRQERMRRRETERDLRRSRERESLLRRLKMPRRSRRRCSSKCKKSLQL